MSQAEDLLNSLTETTIDHKHIVPDSDTYFRIDPYTREIINTNYNKTVLMRGDHNSERFTFEVPRYVDGHDMSLCNRVIVHFDNVGATINEVHSDVDYMKDLRINPDNPETVISSWLIRREATQIVGILSFSLQYQCVEGDEVTYEWNTDSYDEIEIRKSKNNGEAAVIQYTNVLEQWRSQIFGAGDSVMANITSEGANQVAAVKEESATQQAAIELKGSETLATIPDDYTEVYNMASEAVRTKADGIVCEAEGEIITVTDASDDYVRGLNLYGKSTQFTTTGKNLFTVTEAFKNPIMSYDETSQKFTVSTGTFGVVQQLRRFDEPIPAGSNVTVSIWFDSGYLASASAVVFGGYQDNGSASSWQCEVRIPNEVNLAGKYYTASVVTTEDTNSIVFFANAGTTITTDLVCKVQYELNSEATDYEPYTGGIPAPNPDYPQEIVSIENPEIVVLGKNLLRDSKIQKKTVYNGLTSEYEGDGVFHIYGTFNGTNQGMQFSTSYLNIPINRTDSFTMSAQLVEGVIPDDFHPYLGLKSKTIEVQNWFSLKLTSDMKVGDVVSATSKPGWVLAEPTHIARFWLYSYNDELTPYTADFRIKIWVEKSEVNTGYQASSEGMLNVSRILPGIPVTSGGNYTDSDGQQWICDEVDLDRGVYIKRIFNKTFTDFSDAINYSYDGNGTSCALAVGEQLVATMGMCSHLPLTTNTTGSNRFNPIDGVIYFKLESELAFDELKAKLTEMSPTIVAILATHTETPLTAEEIEAYKALKTNYPNTTILNDAGATMKVKYNADTKLYIDSAAVNVVEGVLNDTY